MIELFFRHSWIGLIFVSAINAAVWWYRGKRVRAQHPERAASYKRMIAWMLIAGNIPWLILGGGVLFGGFILPIDPIILSGMNLWGWAFWICIPLWLVGLILYVFWFDGADELSKHPGLVNLPGRMQTPNAWRLMVIAIVAMQAVLLPVVWMNKGNPNFAYDDLFPRSNSNQ